METAEGTEVVEVSESSTTSDAVVVSEVVIVDQVEEIKEEEVKSQEPTGSDSEEYETLEEDNVDAESGQTGHSEEADEGDEPDESKEEPEVEGQREAGDGEENKDRRLDHDEDKRDPQYIPKRGLFYEHDLRGSEDGGGEKVELPKEPRKCRIDEMSRWGHDKFILEDQGPKSRQELVDQYGYDIRSEEGPPKARRRRRYGRGPNKYDRSWEDETAYSKPTGKPRGSWRPKKDLPEFPTLDQSHGKHVEPDQDHHAATEPPPPARAHLSSPAAHSPHPPHTPHAAHQPEEQPRGPPRSRPTKKPAAVETTRGRGKTYTLVQDSAPKLPPFKVISETDEADIAALSKQFSNAVINIGRDSKTALPIRASSLPAEAKPEKDEDEHKTRSKTPEAVNQSVDQTRSKSKRYSAQRQRSLPRSTAAPVASGQVYVQPYFQQGESDVIYGSPAYPANMQNNAQESIPPPTHPQVMFIPHPGPYPGGQPSLLFPSPGFLPPPPDPLYPAPLPPPLPRPLDTGGITYYSPQGQMARQTNPSRRVKVAIPILPPSDMPS